MSGAPARLVALLWSPVIRVGGAMTTVVGNWIDDRCSSMSAALAFYAAFTLAPMLLIVIAVASVLVGREAVQGRLYAEIGGLVGKDGAIALQAMVASARKAGQGGWVSLASTVATAVGASATFAELHSALNQIWRARPSSHPMVAMLRVRLTAFGLVVGTGFLVVVLLIADAVISYATDFFLGDAALDPVAKAIQRGVSFVILAFAFTALLKVLPDARVAWRHAGAGGVAAAFLFTVGKHAFALYLTYASTANVFGAASSLAVLMMWLFFSAAVFLLGAEVSALPSRHPPGVAAPEPAAAATRAADAAPTEETPSLLRP